MDNGAHFYKCDFQVHTPRDFGWDGAIPVTEEERKSYAGDFIEACRAKGLDSVAITDHHDFAFFPYIRDGARNELDSAGKPVEENKRIIVFPGLELSLSSPPCQAILILDALFPDEFLPTC
jgi:type III restriction enzyme